MRIALTTLVVADYDDALDFYVHALGFSVTEDTDLGGGKRWLVVTPSGGGAGLLLARASGAAQVASVGHQTGGRVMGFLHTDDFTRDHGRMTAAGVIFLEAPRAEPYGTVVVFQDLYGNRWDLIGPQG
ncbi:VOC family protein [soil metagenome]